ncbi:flagellar hook-length control protein FliK [Treponema zuelzerae]|uniref:Flagellar hook-length control protein FliK n=1 Tax=Teretinema zuelzerae TaxID=156 RepID=A0AAE3EHM4_9SPIR|nr:flagellar hook-length control protein FliK [Teretinema zuelzerae]MCD1654827.1 flagellar hook-length control protein FliK [Teretinema zuelzerae]
MIQTLDLQLPVAADKIAESTRKGLEGKTGAESVRKGSSFLALIEKMIAGSMEGAYAERGAEDSMSVPENAASGLKKGSKGKTSKLVSFNPQTKDAPKGERSLNRNEIDSASPDEALSNLKKNGKKASPLREEVSARTALEAELPLEKPEREDEGARVDGIAHRIDIALKPEIKRNTHTNADEAESGAAGERLSIEADSLSLHARAETSGTEISGTATKKESKARIGLRDERRIEGDSPLRTSETSSTAAETPAQESSIDMSIGFRADASVKSDRGEGMYSRGPAEGGQNSFTRMLSSEISAQSSEFVKAGQIILRDNNSGVIRLTLHPESLGSVQIRLDLSDRKINGKIIVSSQEAWDAFSDNLTGLSEAFTEGGFESAGFDLSWSGEGSSYGKQAEAEAAKISPFYASSIPSVMSDGSSADTRISGITGRSLSGINVFA